MNNTQHLIQNTASVDAAYNPKSAALLRLTTIFALSVWLIVSVTFLGFRGMSVDSTVQFSFYHLPVDIIPLILAPMLLGGVFYSPKFIQPIAILIALAIMALVFILGPLRGTAHIILFTPTIALVVLAVGPRFALLAGFSFVAWWYAVAYHFTPADLQVETISARIVLGLLMMIWPLTTLAHAQGDWAKIRTTATKQFLISASAANLLLPLLLPGFSNNIYMMAGLSFVFWLWLRPVKVIKTHQAITIIAIASSALIYNLTRLDGLPLFVLPAWILTAHLVLQRHQAMALSITYCLLAIASQNIADPFVIRGIVSALVTTFIMALWTKRGQDQDQDQDPFELRSFNIAIGIAAIVCLMSLIPVITGDMVLSRPEAALRLGIFAVLMFAIITWAAYTAIREITLNTLKITNTLKREATAKQQLQTAAEFAGLATGVLHLNTLKFEDHHNSVQTLYGMPAGREVTMEACQQAIHPDDLAITAQFDDEWQQGKDATCEHRIIVDGTVKWVKVRVAYVTSDTDPQVMFTALDITDFKQKSADLELSQRYTELGVSAANIGLWTMDFIHNTVQANSQYYALLGLDDQSINTMEEGDQAWQACLHPDDKQRVLKQRDEAMAEPDLTSMTMNYRIVTPKGELRWLKIDVQLERNAQGQIITAIGAATDETAWILAQQEAKAQEERINLVLGTSDIGLFEVDLETQTSTFIAGTHPFFTPGDTFEIEDLLDQLPMSEPEKQNMRKLHTIDQHSVEIVRTHPETKAPIWISSTSGTTYNVGDHQKRLIVTKDTTELNLVIQALKKKSEQQSDMFAVIGHELRTPVAAIQMLLEDRSIPEPDQLNEIKGISKHLLDVLEDLRVVVNPERASEGKTEWAALDDIVTRAASPLKPMLAQKEMTLSLELSSLNREAFSNPQALRQLVSNLIKNAAIHSHGDHVQLITAYRPIDDHQYEYTLSVADDGKGIPSSDVESLFKAFSRGDTQEDGTGLGLFIVKQLATQLGGTVTYKTSSMGGAQFDVRFVVDTRPKNGTQAQTEAESINQDQTSVINGLNILMAEDDRMLRMLTTNTLNKQGAQVKAFENGQLALAAYPKDNYDLIITDLMMPVMDGKALTIALRQNGCTLPIIAVTAAVVGEETEQLLNVGVDAVIAKPINADKLTSALLEIQQKRGKHNAPA